MEYREISLVEHNRILKSMKYKLDILFGVVSIYFGAKTINVNITFPIINEEVI